MNPQEQYWSGEAGDAYTARNRVDWTTRVPFWSRIINRAYPGNAFELGCNAGWNTRAIKETKMGVRVVGCDVNKAAIEEATSYGLAALCGDLAHAQRAYPPGTFDLVYTVGVLIHVPPEELTATMQGLIALSNRWVLAVEYEGAIEEAIEYRGEWDKLWRRPFGKLYQEQGLRIVEEFDAGPAFDRCTAWLMEKQQ